MIARIARAEYVQVFRDGRFRAASGLVFLLLLIAVGAGWTGYRENSRERALAQKDAREVWLGQSNKNPHSAAHYGTYVFKPPMPLSLVDTGLDPYLGTTIYLEAHKQNEAQFRPAEERSSLQRFGELTAALVLQALIPLTIILFTFNVFSGEREAGTLRLLLSLGVPARALVFGKALGIAMSLATLLVPAALAGGAVLWLSSAPAGSLPDVGRLLGMNVAYLLYFGGILGLALAVSLRASSANLALVLLLGFWVSNTLIAPRVISIFAENLAQAPSAAQFWSQITREIESGIDGHDSMRARIESLKQQVMKTYGVSRVEDLPVNFAGIALQAGEESSNAVFDRNFGRLWDTYERQAAIHQLAGAVAPMLAIRSFSMAMAGTDFAHHRQFAMAAEQYRRQFVKSLNENLTYHSRPGKNYIAGRETWEQIPDFEYRMPEARWALGKQLVSAAGLAAWFLCGLASSLLAASDMKSVELA